LVYNGEEFVAPCMSSLAGLDAEDNDVDILVLDDASPSPGWSERCRLLADESGFGYYRTPRNLGIPRNMNLGMLRAVNAGYDAMILLNSDTVLPRNLVPTLVRPLQEDPTISSTTAWSNSVSIYSLPNENPDGLGAQPDLVSWISEQTDREFDGQTLPVPSGVGFCMALSTTAIARVGLMDPVFGRGYSEEIDWCLRSHTEGYSSVLAPSCFVYHAGSGITRAEGMIGRGDHIVHAHQAIIDQRYPLYRSQLIAFVASSIPSGMQERGLRRIIQTAARDYGYHLEVSRVSARPGDPHQVRFVIDSESPGPIITAQYEGFRASFAVGEGGIIPTVTSIAGRPPDEIRIFNRGPSSDRILEQVSGERTSIVRQPAYRESVF
jgi:GT2 family glycosyltransferase